MGHKYLSRLNPSDIVRVWDALSRRHPSSCARMSHGASSSVASWTCLRATWTTSAHAYVDARADDAGALRAAFRRVGLGGDDDDDDDDDARAREACAGVGCAMMTTTTTTMMDGSVVSPARALAMRCATRKVLREFGEDADAQARDAGAALGECAEKTVLPRRADAILRALHAMARCGKALDVALVPGAVPVLPTCGGVMDPERATRVATKNASVASAYYEALACVLGCKNDECLTYFKRLGDVDVFNDDKLVVFGVIETFLGLLDAPKERGDASAECARASGALRSFISRGFNAMATRDDCDRAMVKRFMSFVLACLRCDNASFARVAFEGVEASEPAVALQVCLSRTAEEPAAAEVYAEIKRRMS